jgi:hypothetical protein
MIYHELYEMLLKPYDEQEKQWKWSAKKDLIGPDTK